MYWSAYDKRETPGAETPGARALSAEGTLSEA